MIEKKKKNVLLILQLQDIFFMYCWIIFLNHMITEENVMTIYQIKIQYH